MAERVDAPRVVLWLYGLFVVAAGARSAVQLSLHASRAPVAYALSAVAAATYATGLVLVGRAARGGPAGPARACAVAELVGVLAVGTVSVAQPALFPEATVWSYYGAGYLCLPLALPAFVLLTVSPGHRVRPPVESGAAPGAAMNLDDPEALSTGRRSRIRTRCRS